MKIKNLVFDEKEILELYLDNGWYAYTEEKDKLFNGIKNSLDVFAAYEDGKLVGLLRTIGDKFTIIYIQDVLIKKEYQGQGIGTQLVQLVLNKYKDVRQIILSADKKDSLRGFYEPLGFKEYRDMNVVGFYYKKDK